MPPHPVDSPASETVACRTRFPSTDFFLSDLRFHLTLRKAPRNSELCQRVRIGRSRSSSGRIIIFCSANMLFPLPVTFDFNRSIIFLLYQNFVKKAILLLQISVKKQPCICKAVFILLIGWLCVFIIIFIGGAVFL